ncbi:MAG TPA: hypothetical protein VNH53_03975 [Sphingomicrobium sp.]|nr:hypothetical protein [Sphingomicrobium sp.]
MSARLEELDRTSRERPLETAESLELERAICRVEGRRCSHGVTKELARAGVKRSGRRIFG